MFSLNIFLSAVSVSPRDRINSISGRARHIGKSVPKRMRSSPYRAINSFTLSAGTAKKVLEISDQIVRENNLTTLMITHNMKDAIAHGNRLIMMNEGRVILDVSGEEKKHLTVKDLMDRFAAIAGETIDSDEVLLSK